MCLNKIFLAEDISSSILLCTLLTSTSTDLLIYLLNYTIAYSPHPLTESLTPIHIYSFTAQNDMHIILFVLLPTLPLTHSLTYSFHY